MAEENPYNDLGQILSQGGEIALGMAIALGYSAERINAIVNQRFEPLAPGDRDRLFKLANDMVRAGSLFELSDKVTEMNLADIPINENVFGDELEGRRMRIIGVVSFPDGKTPINVYTTLPYLMPGQQILEHLEQQARDMIEESPDLLNKLGNVDPAGGIAKVILMERAN